MPFSDWIRGAGCNCAGNIFFGCTNHLLHPFSQGKVGDDGGRQGAPGAIIVVGRNSTAGKGDCSLFVSQIEKIVSAIPFEMHSLERYIGATEFTVVDGRLFQLFKSRNFSTQHY